MKDPILLLHGALGSKKQFETLKIKLSDSFDVYDLDFEGHGGFESQKEFSIALFTQNVIDFLQRNAIEKVHIFGYSMGGYVALNTALKIPNKIMKIVTLGTKFNWDIASAEKEVKMLNPDKIEEKIPQYAEKLRIEHHPQDWKEIVYNTAKMMIGLSQGGMLNDYELSQIQHQVTIGIGNLDKMVGFEESERIASIVPNAVVKQLMGFEHAIDKIKPAELTLFIEESLK